MGVLQRYNKYFYLFGWGFPAVSRSHFCDLLFFSHEIFAVSAVLSHSIGYGPPLAWCFIHFEGIEGRQEKDKRIYHSLYRIWIWEWIIIEGLSSFLYPQ